MAPLECSNVRLRVFVVPPDDRDAKVRQDGHERKQNGPNNKGTHDGKRNGGQWEPRAADYSTSTRMMVREEKVDPGRWGKW